jgi:CMP-N-acetylneuraminic acid synthetase
MIPIYIFAREESERCKKKALRPFYKNYSLTELFLKKFQNRKDVILAARGERFEAMAKKYNITHLDRPEQSVMGETLKDIFCFLKDCEYTDILSLNVCCPFTSIHTIDQSIQYYKANKLLALMPAFATHEIILDKNKTPLNHDAHEMNSKRRDPLYFMANNFYILNVPRFWENNGKIFPGYTTNDPYFYEISYFESLDIDTEEQFHVVQAIHNQNPSILE